MAIDWKDYTDCLNEMQEVIGVKNASYLINWNKETRMFTVCVFTGDELINEHCEVFDSAELFIAVHDAIGYLRKLK